jgi:low affinity Fe/Cu permease
MKNPFGAFAHHVAEVVGTPGAFFVACLVILMWALTGPLFHFSDTWQLIINTATTIVTFLMVFSIQYVQNRDSKSLHLKLDELIKATHTASNELIDLDRLTDKELQTLEANYKKISEHAVMRRNHQRKVS